MTNPSESFFGMIDYPALREQKGVLASVRNSFPPNSIIRENLTGILHLIDAIQDHAVVELIAAESDVFPKGGDE